ncbi:alpha/beta fold hydrolase [Algoriphagus namhaensis]
MEVPLDHLNPNSRKISIEYLFNEPFDPNKKTILTHADPLDEFLGVGHLTEVKTEEFNVIHVRGRYSSPGLTNFFDENPTITWSDKYRWLNRYQVIQDMEWIRKAFLGNSPVILLGFGSNAGLVHYYLHEYPNQVEKVVSLNPLLLDIPKNLSFWDLLESFDDLSKNFSAEEIIHFSAQADQPYFFMDKLSRDSLISEHMNIFLQSDTKRSIEDLFPSLGARAFEHFMDIGIYDLGTLGHFLRLLSIDLRNEPSKKILEIYQGTNYDLGKQFTSKMIVIGGAYNLLLDPKSFDAIGELYPNSNVFLLKDGYNFSRTREAEIWNDLLAVFYSDDTPGQVRMYAKLQGMDLLFQDRTYNSIRVGN